MRDYDRQPASSALAPRASQPDRGPEDAAPPSRSAPASTAPTMPTASRTRTHSSAATTTPTAPPAPRRADLRRALERGTPEAILAALHALAPTRAATNEALIDRLDDPMQRDALHALQRARWGGGDPEAARDALRRAFRSGPRWRAPRARGTDPLPPLYPERDGESR